MAMPYTDIVGIEKTWKKEAGCWTFGLVIDSPSGITRLPIPTDSLLDYSKVQRLILDRIGCLWRHPLVEGRSQDTQKEQWHSIVSALLDRQATTATPPTVNPPMGGMLN